MKKIVCSCILAVALVGGTQAQETRPLHKGQNSVNLYYGYNVLKGIYKNVAPSDASVEVGGLGPIGLVFEHMVSESVGLGAEIGYGQTNVRWTEEDFFNSQNNTYTYEYKFTTIRAQIRANFHFAKTENFDAYFLISAGYRGNTFAVTSNDPNFAGGSVSGIVPFGLKPGIGLRYFFTENIGLHTEFALGTPMFCGGLSFRF